MSRVFCIKELYCRAVYAFFSDETRKPLKLKTKLEKEFFALSRLCPSGVGYSYSSYKKYRNYCGLPIKTSVPGFKTLVCFSYFAFFMRLAAVGEKKMHKCRGRLCPLQQHSGLEQVSIYRKHKFAVHQLCQVLCDGKAQAAAFGIS